MSLNSGERALLKEVQRLQAELEATKRLVHAAYLYYEGEGDYALIGAVEAHKRATKEAS